MKMVNTLKRLISIFAIFATSLPVLSYSATQSSYPTKGIPVAGDKALITDSADGNKTKQATVGSFPISTATQTALDGKETKAVVQASAPADTTVDWYDTDQESGVLILKRHNGTTWIRASSYGVQYLADCSLIPAGMCINTTTKKLYYHDGSAVVEVAAGGAGISHATSDGGYYASKDGAWASLSGVFAAPLSSDDNYVTDAEKTKLSNLSGTNTGDQDITGKADISCFADSVSFNACFALDWPTGGSQTASTTPFTPSGSIEATTVQAAIQEVRDEAASGSLPAWMPSTGPTNGRQILQATGGCTLSAYDNQADRETNSGTWTTPTYQNTSIISGLINDTGTANDDLWSAAKVTSELAGKQASLGFTPQPALGFTPENAANKGTANGYAGLGSDGKVPSSQLPTLGTTYNLPSLADAQAGTSTTPYVWSPQRVAQAIVALAPSAATSLQMTFVSDNSLETQTGSKTKVPTGVDFTTADIGCDVSDSITFTLRKSSTVNGTYSTVGTISVSAAAQNESIDISSWANLTAGDWVRIDLTTAGTTAKECTVVIGGTEL